MLNDTVNNQLSRIVHNAALYYKIVEFLFLRLLNRREDLLPDTVRADLLDAHAAPFLSISAAALENVSIGSGPVDRLPILSVSVSAMPGQ